MLEVAVSDPRDVSGAAEGGADRLHMAVPGSDLLRCRRSRQLVSALCRESDLPVFVLLRLNDSWSTTGGEFARLVGLGEDYLACGATGVAFGFLDADLEIDTETCPMLLDRLPNVPWTFHPRDRLLAGPAPLLAAAARPSAPGRGPVSGLAARHGDGLRRPAGHRSLPRTPGWSCPAAGWPPSTCRGCSRPGVRQLHLGTQVRPGGSAKAYVDAAYVRSWRSMVDDLLDDSDR